jgi:hypothetical protein
MRRFDTTRGCCSVGFRSKQMHLVDCFYTTHCQQTDNKETQASKPNSISQIKRKIGGSAGWLVDGLFFFFFLTIGGSTFQTKRSNLQVPAKDKPSALCLSIPDPTATGEQNHDRPCSKKGCTSRRAGKQNHIQLLFQRNISQQQGCSFFFSMDGPTAATCYPFVYFGPEQKGAIATFGTARRIAAKKNFWFW